MVQRFMKALSVLAVILAFGLALDRETQAAEGDRKALKSPGWSHNGPFGTYDRAAMQRGLQVYEEVCSACHSMKYIAFRDLLDIGFTSDQAAAIAGEKTVTDGPNHDGDMFDRPARLSDFFPAPFPNANAAAASFGTAPPDLSLMSKARERGNDYIYSLLSGFGEPDASGKPITCADGTHVNPYFRSGNCLAMPPPLSDDLVEYVDGTPATVAQMAHDVTTFLAWTAEPKMEARKQMGVKVILFLIFLSALLYLAKKRIWGRLDEG